MEYILTVTCDLRIQAETEDEALAIASEIDLGKHYVLDTFEITNVSTRLRLDETMEAL